MPSKALADYIAWVGKFFDLERDGKGRPRLVRKAPAAAAAAASSSSASTKVPEKRKSKLDAIEKKPEPCKGGCKEETCSRAGSSVKFIQLTCYKCGHRTKTERPKPVPKVDPEKCDHPESEIDHRGSNKAVHRVYCKKCCNFVDEMPQHLWKERVATSSTVQQSPTSVHETVARAVREEKLTADLSGEFRVRVALQRRSLALDLCKMATYSYIESYHDRLFRLMLSEVPDSHANISMAQILSADKAVL